MTGRLPILIAFLLALLVAAVLAACGDDDSGDNENGDATPTPSSGNITLISVSYDGKACTYSGEPGLPPGTGSLVLVNQSNKSGTVSLWRIDDARTYEDFQTFYDENPGLAAGEFPDWATVAATSEGSEVPPSTTFSIPVELTAGLYAIECPTGGDDGKLVGEISVAE